MKTDKNIPGFIMTSETGSFARSRLVKSMFRLSLKRNSRGLRQGLDLIAALGLFGSLTLEMASQASSKMVPYTSMKLMKRRPFKLLGMRSWTTALLQELLARW